MARAVIIGAGPGGLAAAMILAHAGVQVDVLERLDRPGGRCGAWTQGGFRFDVGPTFFLYPRILQEIFQSVGKTLEHEVPMTRLDPQYRLVFGQGGEVLATSDVPEMQRQMARFSPADAARLPAFLAENRAKLEAFAPVLENPFPSWTGLFRPEMLKLLPLLRPWASLDQELRRHFQDPRLRLAFGFQSKYLGMSPFQCPSLFSILSFLEYEHGVFHPRGGCSAVSDTMARLAAEMGARFHYGEEVSRIQFDGRRPVGVITARDRYPCDAVVLNADFAQAAQKLIPEELRPRWTNRKLARKRYSCSTYMLYLGVRGKVNAPHHTIYFSANYEANLQDITRNYRLSEDPSCYVCHATATDSTMAPEGHSNLYVLVPVPHRHPRLDWSVEGPRMRARTLEQLRRLDLDLTGRIVVERQFTPDDWEGLEVYRGATFSLAHGLDQMLFLRPQNRLKPLQNFYLVGGATHPGSGLPVIYSSARISCRLLAEDLGVQLGSALPQPVLC